MKKTKLFGTRIIENIQVPHTPRIIMLNSYDNVINLRFEDGDILDANSIKYIIRKFNLIHCGDINDIQLEEFKKQILGDVQRIIEDFTVNINIYTIPNQEIDNL